jgi:bifunctional DNA-binding transcriptional regulator/antitoxin component of YhaV-PrlF toxin-antitoxin module
MKSKVKAKKASPTRRGRTSTSRISSKNQVTVPVDILRAIGLETGDNVTFEIKDGVIVMTPQEIDDHPLRLLIGAGKGIYDNFDLAKERETMWPQ